MARQDYGWVCDDPSSVPIRWYVYNLTDDCPAADGAIVQVTFATKEDEPTLSYTPADNKDKNAALWNTADARYRANTDSIIGRLVFADQTERTFVIARNFANNTIECYVFPKAGGVIGAPDDGSWTGHR